MPTFSASAMNPNGSYQADPFDQADMNNRNQSLMAQLALAQLRSGDARFGAERADRAAELGAEYGYKNNALGMQDKWNGLGLAAQQNALDKQYGFLGEESKNRQNQWQQQFELNKTDVLNRQDLNNAQKKLALQEIADREEEATRRRNAQNNPSVVPYTPKTKAGQLAQQSAALSGAGIGVQGVTAEQADLPALQASADTEAQGIGADLAALEKRASSIRPWQSIDSGEIGSVQQRLQKLQKMYTDAGLPENDARNRVQNLVRTAMPTNHTILFGENPTSALYKALGIQLPN